LETIGTPDVPFCAAGKVATAVVLARRSAPERIRRRHPQHRLPSAVPHAVRPALAASRACSCCCAPPGTSGALPQPTRDGTQTGSS